MRTKTQTKPARRRAAALAASACALWGAASLCAEELEPSEKAPQAVQSGMPESVLRSPRPKLRRGAPDSVQQLLVQVWADPYTKPEGIRFPVKSGASAEAYLGKEERRDKEFTKRGIRIEVVPTLISREKVNVGIKMEVAWPGEEPETLGTVTDIDLNLGEKVVLFRGEGKRIEIQVSLHQPEGR